MFTSDDTITMQGGKVTGIINWKHKTLFGRDYDWQYDNDFVGFKRIILLSSSAQNVFLKASDGNYNNTSATKYDGKILPNNSPMSASADLILRTNDCVYLTVLDTDSNWAESIPPNADEVKAFMNGWRSNWNDGTRYTCFINVNYTGAMAMTDPTAFPPGTATTLTVAATGITTITVADATIFKVGDIINVWGSSARTITAISANVITISVASGAAVIGATVSRVDLTGSDTRLITYCKNNVAPNYDGYQLHYKLAVPDTTTDVDVHLHGDIPKFDIGDNYVYIDTGIVIGEVANPASDGGSLYVLDRRSVPSTRLKSPWSETALATYKNNIFDSLWSKGTAYDGNWFGTWWTLPIANYDATAVYTVDYKILATMAPTIGSVACSYAQDIVSSITKAVEAVESRQVHDTALDTFVDSSMYEVVTLLDGYPVDWNWCNGVVTISIFIPLVAKKTTPAISIVPSAIWINNYAIYSGGFTISTMQINKKGVVLKYTISSATNSSDIRTYGAWLAGTWQITADCRGRI